VIRRAGLLLVVIGLSPLVVSALAGWLAELAECPMEKVFEDEILICRFFGADLGEVLYRLNGLRWIWIEVLPVAILGGIMVAAGGRGPR
jgi:hypothetical protein